MDIVKFQNNIQGFENKRAVEPVHKWNTCMECFQPVLDRSDEEVVSKVSVEGLDVPSDYLSVSSTSSVKAFYKIERVFKNVRNKV